MPFSHRFPEYGSVPRVVRGPSLIKATTESRRAMSVHTAEYEARWTEWVARYAESDRRARRRMGRLALVIGVVAVLLAILGL